VDEMHIKDGVLRAYIDKELTIERDQKVVQHLEACPTCRERLTRIRSGVELAKAVFPSVNVNEPNITLSKQTARTRLRHKIDQKEKMPMWRNLTNSKLRPMYIGLGILLVVAVSFSFPQVRATANTFLDLFRVQQVSIVQSALTMNEVPDQIDSAFMLMDDFIEDKIQYEVTGETMTVATEAEAEALVDFDVRIPEIDEDIRIEVQPQVDATMIVERDLWQAVIEQMGFDLTLPEELDGAMVNVSIPRSVVLYIGQCDYNQEDEISGEFYRYQCSLYTQMPSPTVEAPEGLDLNQLGLIYLQVAGVTAEDAQKFSQDVDWANTLVIPVPRDATYTELQLDGTTGYLFEKTRDRYYSLLWLKDDIVNVINGNVPNHWLNIVDGLN
jgi:hypothetical protein